MTLTEFLLARLAEDEHAAEYWFLADVRAWSADGNDVRWAGGFIAEGVGDHVADHIARHNPARVLADVEAKRRIVEALSHEPPPSGSEWARLTNFNLHALLALPYADHPDFDESWRP